MVQINAYYQNGALCVYKHQRRRRKCINQTIKQADRVLTAGPINASGNCPHTLSIYYTGLLLAVAYMSCWT